MGDRTIVSIGNLVKKIENHIPKKGEVLGAIQLNGKRSDSSGSNIFNFGYSFLGKEAKEDIICGRRDEEFYEINNNPIMKAKKLFLSYFNEKLISIFTIKEKKNSEIVEVNYDYKKMDLYTYPCDPLII